MLPNQHQSQLQHHHPAGGRGVQVQVHCRPAFVSNIWASALVRSFNPCCQPSPLLNLLLPGITSTTTVNRSQQRNPQRQGKLSPGHRLNHRRPPHRRPQSISHLPNVVGSVVHCSRARILRTNDSTQATTAIFFSCHCEYHPTPYRHGGLLEDFCVRLALEVLR
jgi:hypothetical protein